MGGGWGGAVGWVPGFRLWDMGWAAVSKGFSREKLSCPRMFPWTPGTICFGTYACGGVDARQAEEAKGWLEALDAGLSAQLG